jgi:hypothetical protein
VLNKTVEFAFWNCFIPSFAPNRLECLEDQKALREYKSGDTCAVLICGQRLQINMVKVPRIGIEAV